jgi:hypothetical protein
LRTCGKLDAVAYAFAACESECSFDDFRRIQHFVMSQALRAEQARAGPETRIAFAFFPRHFVIVEIVHDQAGLAEHGHVAMRGQIARGDAGAMFEPIEERVAQMRTKPYEAEKTMRGGFDIRRRRHQHQALCAPAFILCDGKRGAAHGVANGQRGMAEVLADSARGGDEIRQGA